VIVLVTRPLAQSQSLAERLSVRGHEPLLLPLLRIEPVAHAVLTLEQTLEGAQALLFTSANGVRAFAAASSRRDLPVFAVGEQTAAAARDAGFTTIETAGGDVTSLVTLAAERLAPEAGALIHAAGETTAGDLTGTLEARGFRVRRVTLYRAEATHALDAATESALRAGRIGAAMFFSPRTAAIFVALLHASKLESALTTTTALALSPAVAAVLAPLPWARVLTAGEPTEAALLAALDLVATPTPVRESAAAMSVPEVIPPSAPAEPNPPAPDLTGSPGGANGSGTKSSSGSRWMLAGLVLALMLASAAVAGVAYLITPPPGGGTADAEKLRSIETRLAALESRLDAVERTSARASALETRLAALEQRTADASAASGKSTQQAEALADRVAALEQHLTAVPEGGGALDAVEAATKKLEAETQSLAQKLDAQSASLADLAARQKSEPGRSDAALLIALQELRMALAGSGPFAAPLKTAETLARDQADLMPGLQALEAHAESGIPSLSLLSERFEPMASRVLETAPAEPDQGWLAASESFLMRFFNVRRGSGGSETETTLAAAQAALKRGDLPGAIDALKRLDGAGAEAAHAWIADAEARTEAEQRLAAVDEAVRRRLLTRGTQGSAP